MQFENKVFGLKKPFFVGIGLVFMCIVWLFWILTFHHEFYVKLSFIANFLLSLFLSAGCCFYLDMFYEYFLDLKFKRYVNSLLERKNL